MSFLPMLAKNADPRRVEKMLADPRWVVQQKLDGIRILITVEDGNISGVGRSGRAVDLDLDALAPLKVLDGLWRFDGEYTAHDETLWLFDMPNGGELLDPSFAYHLRAAALFATHKTLLEDVNDIRPVPLAITETDKRELLATCRAANAEGVMFKHLDGRYLPGSRSDQMLKHKFTETVDIVILEVGREGKASIAVGAFHHGVLTDIGSVKMKESDLQQAKPGMVAEVRYLYVNSEQDMRLYQPVFLRFRDDKSPEECTTGQLKFTNRTVRED